MLVDVVGSGDTIVVAVVVVVVVVVSTGRSGCHYCPENPKDATILFGGRGKYQMERAKMFAAVQIDVVHDC